MQPDLCPVPMTPDGPPCVRGADHLGYHRGAADHIEWSYTCCWEVYADFTWGAVRCILPLGHAEQHGTESAEAVTHVTVRRELVEALRTVTTVPGGDRTLWRCLQDAGYNMIDLLGEPTLAVIFGEPAGGNR